MIWEDNSNNPSLYLAFRYMIDLGASSTSVIDINSSEDMLGGLSRIIKKLPRTEKVGLFLSGGIDSGILAKLLPRGTHAFTINFDAESDVDEASKAVKYVLENDMIHHVVNVSWEDYEMYEPILMKHKGAPLHPLEVALYKAALAAKAEGISVIITGTGADSNFGGMDKLLSKTWTFDEFIERYTFVNPVSVLKDPHDIKWVYQPYQTSYGIDCIKFIKEIHCVEQQRAFYNAIDLAGLSFVTPFTKMEPKNSLDIERIVRGESKYLVRCVFKMLYPDMAIAEKIPFTRPMEEWFADGFKLKSDIFLEGVHVNKFSGEQRYLLHCLDRFMELQ